MTTIKFIKYQRTILLFFSLLFSTLYNNTFILADGLPFESTSNKSETLLFTFLGITSIYFVSSIINYTFPDFSIFDIFSPTTLPDNIEDIKDVPFKDAYTYKTTGILPSDSIIKHLTNQLLTLKEQNEMLIKQNDFLVDTCNTLRRKINELQQYKNFVIETTNIIEDSSTED